MTRSAARSYASIPGETFGSVSYDASNDNWRIDVAPDVSRMFKNVFQGVAVNRTPPYVIRNRSDIPKRLLWFFDMYPVVMDPKTKKTLKRLAKAHEGVVRDCRSVVSGDWTAPAVVGFREGESPFPFQQKPAALVLKKGSLLLMDDVGLGKTISALNLLTDKTALPAVVVVQAHLSEQWVEEYIETFTTLRAHAVTTGKPYELPDADVYVFRYSNIAGWTQRFAQIAPKTVVYDEIQELRTGTDTEKGRAAMVISRLATYRLGLTATPVYNYGDEIYQIFRFLSPGLLGSFDEFTTEWCRRDDGSHWIVRDPDALGEYLRRQHATLRRSEDDPEVGKQLPRLNRLPIEVDWNAGDVAQDRDLQRELAMRVLHGKFTVAGKAALELDALVRQETGIAKARSVAAYVRMLVDAGKPVLVAAWHREVYRILNEELADLDPVMYTGSETSREKRRAKAAFVEGRSKVMFISLRSGAGLNGLQHVCTDVVFAELDWSPQVHKQVIGRVRRWGQLFQVTAHFLHVNGGSDPVLMGILGLKASQAQGIVDPYKPMQTPDVDTARIKTLARHILGLDETTAVAA